MNRKMTAMIALLAIAVSMPLAYAQSDIPTDIPINFDVSQGIIIAIGAAGGITTAYLGWKRSPDGESFDGRKFIRPVVVAILVSIPLAITASIGIVELNPVTMFMIFMAAIGTATLSKQIK